MTALAGFWSFGGRHDPGAACARMLKSQAIYGPHGAAQWSDGAIALGRSLFKTLDEDRHDRGPIVGADGGLALASDLRLDNRAELLRDLGIAHRDGTALSDAAVLMRALQHWGEAAVERLVGCFAFALWDGRRRQLLLARDFLGQRPLYFHASPEFFAFASMAKGLHSLPEIPVAANALRAIDMLALLPKSGPETFYAEILRVEPGHIVSVTREGISSRRFWNPDLRPLHLKDPRDYEDGLREAFDAAVAAQLRGAGSGVASHLSAGLDSSAVTATAARQLGPGSELFAFTAVPREGFSSKSSAIVDEGPHAAATARLYPNIKHVLIRSPASPLATLDRDFFLFEHPTISLCNGVWNNAINDAARDRNLRVMLTGLTGNLGPSHDGFDLLPRLVSRGRLFRLARTAATLRRNGVRWGTIGSASLSPFLPKRVWRLVSRLRSHGSDPSSYSALSAAAISGALADRASRSGADLSRRPLHDGLAARLAALGRYDVGNFNKGTLAGWGIDHRDPTADRRLIEFCLRIPAEQYLAGGVPRSLARRTFADRLPAEVVAEKRRGYQSADWHESLTAARADLGAELRRISACREAAEILDLEQMRSLLDNWPEGGWDEPGNALDYRHRLLSGISAGHFLRKCARSNAAEGLE